MERIMERIKIKKGRVGSVKVLPSENVDAKEDVCTSHVLGSICTSVSTKLTSQRNDDPYLWRSGLKSLGLSCYTLCLDKREVDSQPKTANEILVALNAKLPPPSTVQYSSVL